MIQTSGETIEKICWPGGHVIADFDIALGDPTVLRRPDDGPFEVEFGLIQLRLGLLDLTRQLADVSVGLADALRHRLRLATCASASVTCACAWLQRGRRRIDLLLASSPVWAGCAGADSRPAALT